MLKISNIKIEDLAHGCVTDRKPNISFSLESDVPGVSLDREYKNEGENVKNR